MRKHVASHRAACAAVLLLVASAALAEQPAMPVTQWGTTSLTTLWKSAWDFSPTIGTVTWGQNVIAQRYSTGASAFFQAGLDVPQGASIVGLELDACDTDAGFQVQAGIYHATDASTSLIGLASTGTGETPGCGRFYAALPTPETVDKETYSYYAVALTGSGTDKTTFGGIRVYYRLQVSPAPATATFNDVPTSDPAFQYIEALVASGVTAGCGGGNYCPDSTLTRRQMAVFLTKALGLQWPGAPQP